MRLGFQKATGFHFPSYEIDRLSDAAHHRRSVIVTAGTQIPADLKWPRVLTLKPNDMQVDVLRVQSDSYNSSSCSSWQMQATDRPGGLAVHVPSI